MLNVLNFVSFRFSQLENLELPMDCTSAPTTGIVHLFVQLVRLDTFNILKSQGPSEAHKPLPKTVYAFMNQLTCIELLSSFS